MSPLWICYETFGGPYDVVRECMPSVEGELYFYFILALYVFYIFIKVVDFIKNIVIQLNS
jgi:hypothetical protein